MKNNQKKIKAMTKTLEIIGAVCGIAGALLMAINSSELAGFAFPIWLVSSIALGVFAYISKLNYLLMLQITFTAINLLGVWNTTIGILLNL